MIKKKKNALIRGISQIIFVLVSNLSGEIIKYSGIINIKRIIVLLRPNIKK